MSETKPVLQIPNDIGAHCREVAKVLASSRAYLEGHIQQQREWAEADGHSEWEVLFPHASIERTSANLKAATDFIEWLAAHGDHQTEVEQQQ